MSLTAFNKEIRLHVAQGFFERLRGLAGRESLGSHEAYWLRPCGAIHTFHMKMSIAVFLLNRQNRVFAVRPSVPPSRVVWVLGTHSVIEMAAIYPQCVEAAVEALQQAVSVWQVGAR
jgi:uncharacterized membrane protein (UPF0127 family)